MTEKQVNENRFLGNSGKQNFPVVGGAGACLHIQFENDLIKKIVLLCCFI